MLIGLKSFTAHSTVNLQ